MQRELILKKHLKSFLLTLFFMIILFVPSTPLKPREIVKHSGNNIPFILVTATVSEEFAVGIMEAGAYEYILKDRLWRLPKAVLNAVDKKKADSKYESTYEKLFFHLENTPLGFIEWDDQLRIKFLSKRAEEILGWNLQEFIEHEKTGYSQVYEEDQPWVFKITEQLLKGKVDRNNIQHRNYTKNGKVIWCNWFNSVLKDKGGKVITIMSLIQDITEGKESEEHLRRSEIRLNEAQAIAHISNWEIDLVQNIHTWSDEFYRIYGLNKDEVQPSAELFLSFMHPDDADFAQKKVQEAFDSFRDSSFNFRFIRKDGLTRHGHAEWRFEFDEQGKPVRLFGILQDITERKEAEDEIKQMNKELRSLSTYLQNIREEERIQIARDIHDELGQQLTALKMDMHFLGEIVEAREESPTAKINEMTELIDEIVKSVRKISSNLRPNILNDVSLVPALTWQSKEVETRFGITVNFISDDQDIEPGLAISTGLFRIYQEALTNAVRHANAHVINSSLKVTDNKIILDIRDDGKGMDINETRKEGFGILGIKERVFIMEALIN